MKDINVVLVESPVEFVLIGPIRDQLKVLVKSKNAGIDLIGYSQDENEDLYINSSIFLNSLIPQKVNSKNFDQLSVRVVPDNEEEFRFSEDFRLTSYMFVWRGVKNNRFNRKINYYFDSNLPDIIFALQNQDLDKLEWTLATIISLCNNSIVDRQKNRNYIFTIGVIYGIIILMTLFIFSDRLTNMFLYR